MGRLRFNLWSAPDLDPIGRELVTEEPLFHWHVTFRAVILPEP